MGSNKTGLEMQRLRHKRAPRLQRLHTDRVSIETQLQHTETDIERKPGRRPVAQPFHIESFVNARTPEAETKGNTNRNLRRLVRLRRESHQQRRNNHQHAQ